MKINNKHVGWFLMLAPPIALFITSVFVCGNLFCDFKHSLGMTKLFCFIYTLVFVVVIPAILFIALVRIIYLLLTEEVEFEFELNPFKDKYALTEEEKEDFEEWKRNRY